MTDDGEGTIFIKNISYSKARELREALNKISSVKNYLPLLNKVTKTYKCVCLSDLKFTSSFLVLPLMYVCACARAFQVFVQFESARDADRLGVWFSLLKQDPGHEIHRQKIPSGVCTSLRKFWYYIVTLCIVGIYRFYLESCCGYQWSSSMF